jgi:hypothetical protein
MTGPTSSEVHAGGTCDATRQFVVSGDQERLIRPQSLVSTGSTASTEHAGGEQDYDDEDDHDHGDPGISIHVRYLTGPATSVTSSSSK